MKKSVCYAAVLLGGAGLLAGCAKEAAATDTANAANNVSVLSTSSIPASSVGISADNRIPAIPVFIDACTSVPVAETGRQMGGSRQCLGISSDATHQAAKIYSGSASFASPVDVTTDGRNLYVVDIFSHVILKVVIATGEVSTFAGSGKPGAADGMGNAASFNEPVGITTDGIYLYVADRGNNKIRKIEIASGKVTTLAGVEICESVPRGFCFLGGITFDGRNLYVVNSGTIRRIDPDNGQVSTLEGTPTSSMTRTRDGNKALRFDHASGITTDGKSLFVVANPRINHLIYKIDIATGEVIDLVDMQRDLGFFKPHLGITTDGEYLYVASSQSHEIFRIALATRQITLLAGSGLAREVADGVRKEASFSVPLGLTSDGRNLYVADSYNRKIRQIELSSSSVTTLDGSDGVGGTSFNVPVEGLATDGKSLFLSDSSNSALRRIDIATGQVWVFTAPNDGMYTTGVFSLPKGLFVEGRMLYVADYANHVLGTIDLESQEIGELAGSGEKGAKDGTGNAASFNYPYGIAGNGTSLFVTDYDNHVIRKIDVAAEAVSTLAGAGIVGYKDGLGKAASFNHPRGLVYDGQYLYVADTFNHAIRKVDSRTGKVTTLAGTGEPGFADGVGRKALLSTPSGIASDGTSLYVADTANHAIRKIEPETGTVSTVAGMGEEGLVDGNGRAARFSRPLDVAFYDGALYVADSGNRRVRKINLASGSVTTLRLSANAQGSAESPIVAPNVPLLEIPDRAGKAATPAAGATPQPDYILKVCQETESTGDPRSAMRAVDPAGMLAIYMQNHNNRTVTMEMRAAIKTTLLQGTTHGKISSVIDNTGRPWYAYDAEPNYIGNDRAVFLAQFDGKVYKIVLELHAFRGAAPGDFGASTCAEPQLIKVTKPAKPSSGASGFGSGYDMNSVSITFADLPGSALGQTTNQTGQARNSS